MLTENNIHVQDKTTRKLRTYCKWSHFCPYRHRLMETVIAYKKFSSLVCFFLTLVALIFPRLTQHPRNCASSGLLGLLLSQYLGAILGSATNTFLSQMEILPRFLKPKSALRQRAVFGPTFEAEERSSAQFLRPKSHILIVGAN